jgi:hypothetical protein
MKSVRTTLHTLLENAASKTASNAPAAVDLHLDRFAELVATLKITAADAGGTYDFYIITGNDLGEWDLVHFTQQAGVTAHTYVARIRSDLLPQTVTTAAPGVLADDSATLSVAASATNAVKSLAAGSVRHGPWGNTLRYELVAAGTITTGVTYSIEIEAR